MAKKRGLGGARGLDALLGNIKKEKALIEPQAAQSPLQNTPKNTRRRTSGVGADGSNMSAIWQVSATQRNE